MPIRFPTPLVPGDRIGVTSPSSGVTAALEPRLDLAIAQLGARGYDVEVGRCMSGDDPASAPPAERAAELESMLCDPSIRAVVPPWGGELAVEILTRIDVGRIAAAEPTWLVGFSDISTITLPLTSLTGVASLHGQNLMDVPYEMTPGMVSWLDVLETPTGGTVEQHAAAATQGPDGWLDYATHPAVSERILNGPGGWRLMDPAAGPLSLSGRLIGGCIETISTLAGTSFGDLRRFREMHAPEGLILHVEASEDGAYDIARNLWRMRLAGWFDAVEGVLVGRTTAPASPGFTQDDAVRSALGDLDIPVVLDVDCGHVPPHLSLVQGALAEVRIDDAAHRVTQHLT